MALIVLGFLLTACSAKDDTSSGSANRAAPVLERTRQAAATLDSLEGTWNGDWRTTAGNQEAGTLRMKLQRVGRVMRGSLELSGSSCLTGGEITAVVNGAQIAFEAFATPEKVTYTGTIADNAIDGSYSMTCGEAKGMWKVTRS